MTDRDGDLDGGLDEPEDLQPAEGSLRLVGDDDTYDVARVGGSDRCRAAQGAPARRGRARTPTCGPR